MSRRFPFKTQEGSINLPVSVDGEFLTDPEIYKHGNLNEFYFEFFEDEACTIPVTPTGGQVISEASPMGNIFLRASSRHITDAYTISYPESNYSPPIVDGLVEVAKIKAISITGANYMRAVLYTHN